MNQVIGLSMLEYISNFERSQSTANWKISSRQNFMPFEVTAFILGFLDRKKWDISPIRLFSKVKFVQDQQTEEEEDNNMKQKHGF